MSPENIDHADRRFPFYIPILVALIAASSVFLATGMLQVTFLSDDTGLVLWGKHMVENDFWFPFLGGSMDPEKPGPTYYRPLALLSHGIDYAAYGWRPTGHHVTSLALHALCCLLVFALTRRALPTHPPMFAFIATALFALHPIHEGAVWWIAGRMELVCALFYLMSTLSFLTYLTSKRIVYLCVATVFGAAAFASKEMAYSLPFVWLAMAFAWRDQPSLAARTRAAFIAASPAIALAAFFLTFRLILFDTQATTFAVDVDAHHLATTARHTLRNLILPYQVSFREWASDYTALFALAFVTIAAIALLQTPRLFSKPVMFGTVWCALTMLPLIRTMSPWTLYLPSVGYCVALAWLLYPRRGMSGLAASALLTAIIVSFVVQLHDRKASWQEADTVARTILSDLHEVHTSTPDQQPIILSLPGLIDDTAVFMHYFEERVQFEFDDPGYKPIILTHLILPPGIDTHGIEVRTLENQDLELIPASPQTRFAFPSVAAFNYRFDAVRPGDVVEMPWGQFELLSPNDAKTITRMRIRLKPGTKKTGTPILVYRDGKLTIIAPE